ncbi:hypothetical protein [Streptomyces sp. CB01580]|uniref:hypothetical protein n=1 Tax=Streptomyces sp. CB01580 TaxID=1703933 RepID=UPI0011611804|nr:hypothetical protein [Streptomyces sp. CB01580]
MIRRARPRARGGDRRADGGGGGAAGGGRAPLDGAPVAGHRRRIAGPSIAAPHGRTVAVVGGDDGTVRVRDLRTPRRIGGPTHFAYRAHTPAPVADGVPLIGFGDEPALLVARPAGRRPMPERRGPDRGLPIVAPS